MMIKIDRQQRNYNFLEIVRAYNKAKNESMGYPFIDSIYSLDLNLIGVETADKIYEAISKDDSEIEDNRSSLSLFYQDDGKLCFALDNKIMPVATKEEAGVIYSMIKNGDFDLYLTNEEKDLLLNNIYSFFENLNIEPVDLYGYIDIKGASLCADDFNSIKETFFVLKQAIRLSKFVKITYNKYQIETFDIQPIEMIYSQLDQKMRVRAFGEDGVCRTYYLDYISDIKMLKNASFLPFKHKCGKNKTLKFSFYNDINLPERIAARFSDYKKEIHYNKRNNRLTYIVEYEDNPTENGRIINRLRSLGMRIDIESPEKQIIQQDAKKALAQYCDM